MCKLNPWWHRAVILKLLWLQCSRCLYSNERRRFNTIDFNALLALHSQLLSRWILESYSAESLQLPPYLRVAKAASLLSCMKWKYRPQTPAVVAVSITALQKGGFIFWYFLSPLFLFTEITVYIFLEFTSIKFRNTPRHVDVSDIQFRGPANSTR